MQKKKQEEVGWSWQAVILLLFGVALLAYAGLQVIRLFEVLTTPPPEPSYTVEISKTWCVPVQNVCGFRYNETLEYKLENCACETKILEHSNIRYDCERIGGLFSVRPTWAIHDMEFDYCRFYKDGELVTVWYEWITLMRVSAE